MTPARRRNFILGVFAALGLLAALFFFNRPEPVRRRPAPLREQLTEPGRIRPPAALSADGSVALRVPEPPSRVPLARPTAAPDAGLRPLTERRAGPTDKRERPGPNAGRQMEIISYAFETLEEDVRDCLQQWESAAPGEAAEVMIAFEIDADGLQRSWLEHEGEVPFGPRTCLANAVFGLDWSRIVDQPAKLTQRFSLVRADAGAP